MDIRLIKQVSFIIKKTSKPFLLYTFNLISFLNVSSRAKVILADYKKHKTADKITKLYVINVYLYIYL